MSDQKQVRQVFKEFKVLTADNAEQIGLSITAMLLLGTGWQVYGPTMAVAKGNGVEYFQAIMLYEYVTEDAPVEAEPNV